MKLFSVVGRRASILGALVGVLGAVGVFAPSAGAVLVHVGHGQVAGVTPIAGVNPASIPGSFARKRSSTSSPDNGTLDYGGGPVLHGSSPYVIFWDPSSKITAADKTLFTRYFADLTADSGKATNVFSVDRQYTDTTGFADYNQTWAPSHLITDTHAYPTTGNCTEHTTGFTESTCLYDNQIQAEVTREVNANGLPTGVTGNAPIYFVVTPPDVNSCFDAPANPATSCADDGYCAYHSVLNDGGSNVLYANIPTLLAADAPKDCQDDGNGAVQAPNGNSMIDVALKYTSHEFNETITDPVDGTGWYDHAPTSGQEDGDECNFTGAADPAAGDNPDAFLPTLGGLASAGTLFDQLINGNKYYTQSEWSNGDISSGNIGCRMQPTADNSLSAGFNAPATAAPGTAVSFTPASSGGGGYSSTTWSWGDGTANSFNTGAPATVSHTYATAGSFTVAQTVVDKFGNLSTVSHTITVKAVPAASFIVSTAKAPAASAIQFNGTASNEPGGSISSYSWSFGDGFTGTGATVSHAFANAGAYTVTLTVADPQGATASTTLPVSISGVPTADMGIVSGHAVADVPFAFDGSQSLDAGSTLTGYSWSFGDGGTGTGVSPSHTFKKTGTFSVTLTVTDASGSTASVTEPLVVKAPSITNVSVTKGSKTEKLKVALSGPGTLKLGSKKTKVKGPKTVTLKVKLSRSQLTTLKSKHKLTVHYKLSFSPAVGKKSSKTVTIKLTSK